METGDSLGRPGQVDSVYRGLPGAHSGQEPNRDFCVTVVCPTWWFFFFFLMFVYTGLFPSAFSIFFS